MYINITLPPYLTCCKTQSVDFVLSFLGGLITITHKLEVKANTAFCVDNPELEIPINICSVEKEAEEEEVNLEGGIPVPPTLPPVEDDASDDGAEPEIAVAPLSGKPDGWASEQVRSDTYPLRDCAI